MELEKSAPRRRPALGPWIILFAIFVYFAGKDYGYQLDDALIYLRYIKNALAGDGLVYNPGVHFNGLTSPLFSYLVLAVSWLSGNPEFASFLVSSVALFLAAIVLARLFEKPMEASGIIAPQLFAAAGAFLLLFLPYFYLTFGMETSLFTLFSALLILLMRERRYQLAGVCAALLFLTRSEGAFLIIAAGVADLVKHRRLPPFSLATYVAPLAIVGAVLSINYVYYGAALPETGMAKIWQGQSGLWGNHLSYLDVKYLYSWVFGSNPFVLATYLIYSLIGIIVIRDPYLVSVIGAYLVVYTLFFVLLNVPNYHWYYSPFFSFAPYFAAAGAGSALTAALRRPRNVRNILLATLALLPMAVVAVIFFNVNSVARGGVDAYRRIGLWMKSHLDGKSLIGMVEIGTVGYYSDRNIVDILGLVNPDNAKFIGERRFDAWLGEYDVTDILVHDPLWNHEISLFGAALTRAVSEDCSFHFPGYRLFHVADGAASGISACDPSRSYFFSGVATANAAVATDESRGHVDSASVVGNFVKIAGWARNADMTPFSSLRYAGNDGRLVWQRQSRDDVAAHFSAPALAHAGFSGAIRFDTYAQAKAALAEGCLLLSASGDAKPAVFPLQAGTICHQQTVEK